MKVFHPNDLLWRRQALFLLFLAFVLGLRVAVSYWIKPLSHVHSPRGQEQRIIYSHGQYPPQRDQAIHRPRKNPPAHPLDLNTATREELMSLPGIGPVLAGRIVSYRVEKGPFTDISEVKEVPGIGEKRYERIEPWVRAGSRER